MIIKGWSFGKDLGYSGSAEKDKVPVRAHERTVQGFAKGGHVKSSHKSAPPSERESRHYDRMENFRKERDSEPASPAAETAMAKGGKFIQKAIKKPGALHKELGVKKGEKIPAKKLAAAAKRGGKEGQRARLAETLKGMRHRKKFAEGGPVGGGGDKPIVDRVVSRSVDRALSKDSKLNRPGGEGTKNVVGFKKGGKAKHGVSRGAKGDTAAKAAGALSQIAAMVQNQGPPAAGLPPKPPMMPPPSLGAGPPPGGPMGAPPPGMKRGGTAKKKK